MSASCRRAIGPSPAGRCREGSGRLARVRTWNAGECCGFAVEEGVDDVGFAVAAIAPVAGAMALDPDLVRVPVPDTLAAWARAHGAASEPVVTHLPDLADDGLRVERHAYAAPGDPAAVVLILVVGGGHTWPGSTARERWLGPSTLDAKVVAVRWGRPVSG